MIALVSTKGRGQVAIHQIVWINPKPFQDGDSWYFNASIPGHEVDLGPWSSQGAAIAWHASTFTVKS